jgi:hypothetical protein
MEHQKLWIRWRRINALRHNDVKNKNKKTILKRGFFRAVTIDTTNKGS